MSLFRVRSFRGRIFLAVLLVGLAPAALAVAGGAWMLQSIGTRSGTLGPWDAVAETGQTLLDELDAAGDASPELREASARHREALSESVRMSRLYSFVADRVVRVLPLVALFAVLAVAAVSYYTARRLSRGFGEPVAELAGWTERIARGEPLPRAAERTSVAELNTLRDALRAMAEQLEEARRRELENVRMRSWTNLARRVAHEIKNPLTPMRMAALTLMRGREGADAEAGRVLLDEIHRLDEMARTFSQYGRMPEGPRSLVDLVELLALLAEQHGSDRIPVAVSADSAASVLVEAHYDALERALRNLVLNAVEAQEVGGGEVELSAEARDGFAVVRVGDRGPGIPLELVEEIWNPDVTTKSRGTGLGLAIVRQTVLHHGGEVEASNREGGGAIFEVRIPSAPGTDTSPRARA